MSSDAYPGQALVEAAGSLWADVRYGMSLFWGAFQSICAVRPPPTGPSVEEERRRLIEQQAYELSQERGSDRQGPEKHWLLAEKRVDERLKVRDQRLKDLGDAANTSATHVNASFLTFMFVWTFVALAIGATTHEQLLSVSPVDMPLVGIKLPIVDFFAVAPYFVLLLHLNLLLQLYLLSRRLHALDAALEQVADPTIRHLHRLKLFPLPFSHFLIGRETRPCMAKLIGLFVFVTLVVMPLLLLAGAEVRFLPFHSETVSWIQRVAVIVDAGLLLLFWPLFRRRDAGLCPSPKRDQALGGTLTPALVAIWRPFRHDMDQAVFMLLVLSFPLFSCFVAVSPGETVEKWLGDSLPAGLTLNPYSINRQCETIPAADTAKDRLFSWYPESVPHYLYATCWLFDRQGAWGQRKLSLPEAVLLAEKPDAATLARLRAMDSTPGAEVLEKVAGFSLVKRDLRFADLSRAVLSNADLRGADLRGTDLGGANLTFARLREADLRGADLRGANLTSARLRGTDLRAAKLQGANLSDTLLEGANLCGVQLWGANLSGARLQCANLFHAGLQGANLFGAQLQHADLSNAGLQGANLRKAMANGAEFDGADWRLTDGLDRTLLTQANLDEVAWGLRESECEGILKRIFNRLPVRQGQRDALESAKDTSEVSPNPIQHFFWKLDPGNNEYDRVEYLGQLGCADSYIRLGLLYQLFYATKSSVEDQNLVLQLGEKLLTEGCPGGGETLPKRLQDEESSFERHLRKWIDEKNFPPACPSADAGTKPTLP